MHDEIEQYLQQLNIRREDFTSQEKLVLSKIISELERTGKSKLLDSLWLEDYEEKPVSMAQFLADPDYAGISTNNGDSIWPSWKQTLTDIFAHGNQYTLVMFSGAIGTGKSTIACLGITYIIYKLLCLKDPSAYYGIMPGSRPGIALFNITLAKGESVAFHKINTTCRSSPWFLRNGEEVGNTSNRKLYIPDKNITIGIGSEASHFIGLDTFCSLMDEVSFKDNKELDMTKMKAYKAFTEINRRMESRFMDMGQIPGTSFIVSSTKHEDDFLSQLKEREGSKPNVLIVEKPLWEAVPAERYCGDKFNLIISNKSSNAFILESEEELPTYQESPDYETYKVPVEHKSTFVSDMQGSIKDILGRALKTANRFLAEDKIHAAVNPAFKNCLDQTLIKLGFRDGSSILDHLDLNLVDPKLISYPLFVHHDLALSGDYAGIYMSAVANDTARDDLTDQDETKSWMFLPVMWCLLAPDRKGEQIPLYKIRLAIKELRDKYGFNIMAVSADGYQSADMLQQYQLMNFNTFLISVDRAPSHAYQFFRSSLYSDKIYLPKDDILINELTRLIENRALQKIDHPGSTTAADDGFGKGSKDLADGAAGSIYCAVEYNKKAKRKIFSDGGYLLTDLISGSRTSTLPPAINIGHETDQALKEIGQDLFNNFDNSAGGDMFTMY